MSGSQPYSLGLDKCRHGAEVGSAAVYEFLLKEQPLLSLHGHIPTDEFRPDIGALWENWVIAEVAKHNALLGSPAELFFWRSRAQSEVDLASNRGAACGRLRSNGRRVSGRAFRDAYGVEVEAIRPDTLCFGDLG